MYTYILGKGLMGLFHWLSPCPGPPLSAPLVLDCIYPIHQHTPMSTMMTTQWHHLCHWDNDDDNTRYPPLSPCHHQHHLYHQDTNNGTAGHPPPSLHHPHQVNSNGDMVAPHVSLGWTPDAHHHHHATTTMLPTTSIRWHNLYHQDNDDAGYPPPSLCYPHHVDNDNMVAPPKMMMMMPPLHPPYCQHDNKNAHTIVPPRPL